METVIWEAEERGKGLYLHLCLSVFGLGCFAQYIYPHLAIFGLVFPLAWTWTWAFQRGRALARTSKQRKKS